MQQTKRARMQPSNASTESKLLEAIQRLDRLILESCRQFVKQDLRIYMVVVNLLMKWFVSELLPFPRLSINRLDACAAFERRDVT